VPNEASAPQRPNGLLHRQLGDSGTSGRSPAIGDGQDSTGRGGDCLLPDSGGSGSLLGRQRTERDARNFVRAAVCVCPGAVRVLGHRSVVAGVDPDASFWAIAQVRGSRRRAAAGCCFQRSCLQPNGSQLAIRPAFLSAQGRGAGAEREMPAPAREQVSCSTPPAHGPASPPTAISSASPAGAGVWSSGVEALEIVPEREPSRAGAYFRFEHFACWRPASARRQPLPLQPGCGRLETSARRHSAPPHVQHRSTAPRRLPLADGSRTQAAPLASAAALAERQERRKLRLRNSRFERFAGPNAPATSRPKPYPAALTVLQRSRARRPR
jgi:hypothetical protein